MSRDRSTRLAVWPTFLGLVAVVVVAVALATVAQRNNPASPIATPTFAASSTPAVAPSPTSNLPPVKATLQEAEHETQSAAPQTPPISSLATATLDTGPSATPNFGDAPHAGAGIIVAHPTIPSNWGRVAINMWLEIPKGIAVYAGGTEDPTQGAVFVLLPGDNPDHPVEYLTPIKVGLIQVVDAQDERIVLKTLDGNNTFYFDVPTRQFVDSLSVTSVAPTVTPLPTEAATPTIEMPTNAPPPTAYPIASPSQATPAPTAQATASY
jgi:hypothetical protein